MWLQLHSLEKSICSYSLVVQKHNLLGDRDEY